MDTTNSDTKVTLTELTVKIVAAYVRNNTVFGGDLSGIISNVYSALENANAGRSVEVPVEKSPAVPIRKSVTPDFIVCLEDGKKLKMLKRYLRSTFDMSPEEYREKWGLPVDYPMVAPNYAKARSEMALKLGLGRKRLRSADKRRKNAA